MSSRSAAQAVGVAAMVLVGALVGCTGAPTPPAQTQTETPVVDFTTAAQTGEPVAVQIPRGGKVVIAFSGPATVHLEPQNWSASIADPTILTFSPADASGRAAIPPLLTGLKKGETTAVVTYTYPNPPQQVTFDVTVLGP
jgi:hypothetical protein